MEGCCDHRKCKSSDNRNFYRNSGFGFVILLLWKPVHNSNASRLFVPGLFSSCGKGSVMLKDTNGPSVDRPLKQFSALIFTCRTCEKERRWNSAQLLARGIWTIDAVSGLMGKMICDDCFNGDRPYREVTIKPWPPIHPGFQQCDARKLPVRVESA